MTEFSKEAFQGMRVLVVEDEFFLADDLVNELKAAGAEPVGPVPTVEQAEARIAEGGIDAAILDMNLRGEKAFELAERVAQRRLPCVIVSGYTGEALPEQIARLPRLEKPVSAATVLKVLELQFTTSAK
jgi:DNA-binding NtrC family response regulator